MLTVKEQRMHETLRRACLRYQSSLEAIVAHLIDAARMKLYRKLGRHNLVEYIAKDLNIDSTLTFDLNRVVRAALDCPRLEQALLKGEVTVGKATRILSSMNTENAADLVAYASTHMFAEINAYVAEQHSAVTTREWFKQISSDQYKITLVLTARQFKDLRRSQSLEAQKQKPAKRGDALGAALITHLWRNDPVQKAERAQARCEARAEAKNKVEVDSTGKVDGEAEAKSNAPCKHESFKAGSMARTTTKSSKPVTKVSFNARRIGSRLVRTTGGRRVRLTAAETHALTLITGGGARLSTRTASVAKATGGSTCTTSFRFRKAVRTNSQI